MILKLRNHHGYQMMKKKLKNQKPYILEVHRPENQNNLTQLLRWFCRMSNKTKQEQVHKSHFTLIISEVLSEVMMMTSLMTQGLKIQSQIFSCPQIKSFDELQQSYLILRLRLLIELQNLRANMFKVYKEQQLISNFSKMRTKLTF